MAQGIRYTNESFIEVAREIHGNKYDYSKVNYVNKTTLITIICPIHGEFQQRPDDHLHKKSGCPKCGKNVYTTESFINKANKIHNFKYDYSKSIYKSVRDKIIITCPEHGDFEQTVRVHLRGGGCFKCRLKSQTKIFNKLLERFPNENIIFEVTNKTIPWLQQQRLDIYFKDYNIGIEYDEQQHFKPIETFGGNKRFEQQKQLDELKNKICENNNCVLFRIPYNYTEDDFDEICSQIEIIISRIMENTDDNTGLIDKLDK